MRKLSNMTGPALFAGSKLYAVAAAALITFSTHSAVADDTEVFFPKVSANPNFLFLVDISGSMGDYDEGAVGTRLDRIKSAITTLVGTADGINVGLMSYAGSTIKLVEAVAPIETNRSAMISSTNALVDGGGTPTVPALYEAGLYLRGEAPLYGCQGNNANHPACGTTYTSPLISECQSNNVVLLTDGSPNGNNAVASIQARLGENCTIANVDGSINGGTCAAEFADYLYNEDNALNIDGDNSIKTHTIGFNFSDPWLANVATAGRGTSTTAETASDLLTVIDNIMTIDSGNQTFVAPAVTLDRFTRLSHRKDMYLGMFKPTNRARWSGNLKKYHFTGNPPVITDSNTLEALDPATGNFYDTAQSFWSTEADGANVEQGGAANLLNTTTRKVYTYTGGASKDLTLSQHAVSESNTAITAAMLNVTDDEVANLLKWARGVDVKDENGNSLTTDTRRHMGDPLHSQPVVLTYGGTKDTPDSLVFMATNEGYLHAVDSATGQEAYAFIPPELLENLDFYYDNHRTTNRLYGLDGDLTLWLDDKNGNGALDSATESAYLYVGMRRGGNNYYALDVTNKTSPRFLWSIKGSQGQFSQLGQSWSKPTLSKVLINNTATDVLIFGGGYDPMQDHASIRSADTIGNALYIVNARTGALIWSAEESDYAAMEFSMPSDPRVIDVDGDGIADQIYIGDMGGQLWRFDINKSASNGNQLVDGGVIANISGTDPADNRRFFYPPDVSLIADGTRTYMSVAIGSGHRAKPLSTDVENRFYMIKQDSVYSAPAGYGIIDETAQVETYTPITEADLYESTNNTHDSAGATTDEQAATARVKKNGWFFRLGLSGEKVLAQSITVDNKIFFSTYVPDTAHTDVCTPAPGGGRAYAVSVYDSQPIGSQRFTDLTRPAIPPPPNAVFTEDGAVTVMVGPEPISTPPVNLTQRLYWSENPEF